ncbi:MAG: SAM-dependent methyltransferase, partial [Acidimicrobiales bacterium]
GECVHRADAYGTDISLTNYRRSPDEVARSVIAAGLLVHARAVREPELDHESTPQAFILARGVAPGR